MTKRPETIDEAAVRELELWVDNDPESYKLKKAVYGALDRKRIREIYDSEKAVKAFYNVAEYAAKSYAKTFNDSMTAWFITFTTTTRREVAKILLSEYEEEVEG